MNTLQITDTIGTLAAKDYRKAEILRKIGVDFTYDGNRSLEEVSQKIGLTVEQLEMALNQSNESKRRTDKEFNTWTVDALIDYIINVHHHLAKENAVIIYDLAQKVSYQRSGYHPELSKLAAGLFLFFDDFLIHLKVEEQILFPVIKQLTKMKNYTGKNNLTAFSSIKKTIQILQKEHLASAKDLKAFRKLTNEYMTPPDACGAHKLLIEKMKEFENDLFMHVHLENNILFPKTMVLSDKFTEKETKIET